MSSLKIGDSMGHGEGTTTCYCLETRLKYPDNPPHKVGDMIIDGVWRPIKVSKSIFGVPSNLWCAEAESHGYLSYDSAMAIAYWFIASVNRTAIEVRLIELEFKTSYSITLKDKLSPIETYYYQPNKSNQLK